MSGGAVMLLMEVRRMRGRAMVKLYFKLWGDGGDDRHFCCSWCSRHAAHGGEAAAGLGVCCSYTFHMHLITTVWIGFAELSAVYICL
jgi:hypothetical protein